MKKILSIFCAVLIALFAHSQSVGEFNGAKIVTGKIIFKYKTSILKNTTTNDAKQNVEFFLQSIGATGLKQKFPQTKNSNCDNCVDISQIYEVYIPENYSFNKALTKLNQMDCIEYAEPSYVGELFFSPNDTEFTQNNLWHLNTCKVLDAWDVEQGDTSVVVAIVDGGIDIIQKDLINKIAYNLNDPINGVDDDGDGYIDNYRGWDIADNDNNPSNTSATEHGTYVAGIASAEVNNEFGTAGVGYKTKFIPVKICPEGTSDVTCGYEGIIYAANHGCKVINCSWGEPIYSQFGEDVIAYATYNCDALVVAAAGNSASKELYFPASYPETISVAGTVAGDFVWYDSKTLGSHYNEFVDVCAPAKNFYSIANYDKTISMSGGGTSFATPIVSGAAALVRSKYPTYSALQIGELLRVTADNIYDINSEKIYKDMLGGGRLNVYAALTNDSIPGIRMVDYEITNNTGQAYTFSGDTIYLKITFKNYLHEAANISISATCEKNFMIPLNNTYTIESIAAGEEFICTFPFRALATPPAGFDMYFKISYNAEKYSDFEFFSILLNNYVYDFELGNIQSTATFDGSIAVYSPYISQNGFKYKNNENCISQGGLILAENQNQIYSRTQKTADFEAYIPPTLIPEDTCDILIYSNYNVNNIMIDQLIFGWEDVDALIYEYQVVNLRDTALHNLKLGTFIDWDILNSKYNQIWYVDSLQLTAVKNVNPKSYYVGYLPLDYNKTGLYAFDIDNDIIFAKDGFNKKEIWYAFTNSQTSAGKKSVYGSEIAAFNYAQIDTIEVEDFASVRFALLAADSEKELYELAYTLKQKYNPTIVIPEDTTTISAVKSPSLSAPKLLRENNSYFIEYEKSTESVSVKVYSIAGKQIMANNIAPDEQTGKMPISLKPGLYLVSIQREGVTTTFKLVE